MSAKWKIEFLNYPLSLGVILLFERVMTLLFQLHMLDLFTGIVTMCYIFPDMFINVHVYSPRGSIQSFINSPTICRWADQVYEKKHTKNVEIKDRSLMLIIMSRYV